MFVHLQRTRSLVGTRIGLRRDHFMNADLVDSQFSGIEPLENDEVGLNVDAAEPVHQQVATIIASNPVTGLRDPSART